MSSKSLTSKVFLSVAMTLALLSSGAPAHADGIVQNASKAAAKGMVKGVQQELNSGEMVNSAKQVTKGMVDGVANAVPLVASQVTNQANVNKKAIGSVARQVSSDAVAGAVGSTVREMDRALGKDAQGPLADTMTATTERVTEAAMRAMVAELKPDPATLEKLTAAAVRGATSEMHFNFSVWPFVLAFALGGVSTLLCGIGLMLMYMLFQRRRATVVEPVPATSIRSTQPILTTG